jgi:hypothetical protein
LECPFETTQGKIDPCSKSWETVEIRGTPGLETHESIVEAEHGALFRDHVELTESP